MNIGLIDVDSHNFPNLVLMKISAWHKAQGDTVEWFWGWNHYDLVYMCKVFDETYTPDTPEPENADRIIKGGTGYVRRSKDEKLEFFIAGKWRSANKYNTFAQYEEFLPYEIEHSYPDYTIYPEMTKNTAYGFLTRGCPRHCNFCIVGDKEGLISKKVADLSEFWNGQKNIKLLDPNILACREHIDLLRQLENSGAYVDFTQGLDIRLANDRNIDLINRIKVKEIHFAWDNPQDDLAPKFQEYANAAKHKPHGQYGTVYVLTNFNTTMDENLYRIYTLRDLGFDPYVMVYDKPNATKEIKRLQRWVNNRMIFRSTKRFEDYTG